jgi:hypothetical protein
MRAADPEMATGFLFDHPVAMPEPGRPTPLFPPVDAVGPRKDLVAPHLLEQARTARLSVHPWTADEPDEIERLIRAGVASVTTNAPDTGLVIRDRMSAETGQSPAPDTGTKFPVLAPADPSLEDVSGASRSKGEEPATDPDPGQPWMTRWVPP